MHHSVMQFFTQNVALAEIEGKQILEAGSFDFNGSLRYIVQKTMSPAEYVGIDMREGPGVDMVLCAEDAKNHFGTDRFDVVLCTEMLEHASDWKIAIYSLKAILKPGGLLVLTTRSVGFPLHEFPSDYWRFSTADMARIFADFCDQLIESDAQCPGVFIRARKP